MMLLKDACQQWWESNLDTWADITAHYIKKQFERYVDGGIGLMDIAEIKPKHILASIKSVEERSPVVARRILQRLVIVFDLAILAEHCETNSARPVLIALKKRKPGEFATLDIPELPKFYARVKECGNSTPVINAFWAIQYTALRRSECIRAKWSEIDMENRMWTIPAIRMKNDKPHLVPLSHQMVALLTRCKLGNRTKWVFPSPHRKGRNRKGKKSRLHIDPWSVLHVIRLAGYEKRMTIHGARKVFSTISHESGLWSIDAIELQLSHVMPGVRGIYNKAMMLDERTRLMQWYADRLDEIRTSGI